MVHFKNMVHLWYNEPSNIVLSEILDRLNCFILSYYVMNLGKGKQHQQYTLNCCLYISHFQPVTPKAPRV